MCLQKSLLGPFHMLHMEASRDNAWIHHPPFDFIWLIYPIRQPLKAMHGSLVLYLSILCYLTSKKDDILHPHDILSVNKFELSLIASSISFVLIFVRYTPISTTNSIWLMYLSPVTSISSCEPVYLNIILNNSFF